MGHRVAKEAPDPPRAQPSRVAVDETAVKIGTEQHWLYAAIDVEKSYCSVCGSPRVEAPNQRPSFSAAWPRNTTVPRRRFSSTGGAT